MDTSETLNRRARLRELVDTCFGGVKASLIRHIKNRTGVTVNHGEISSLMKDHSPAKSFGDKKAKVLTKPSPPSAGFLLSEILLFSIDIAITVR